MPQKLKAGDINPETKTEYTVEEITSYNKGIEIMEAIGKEATVGLISREEAEKQFTAAIEKMESINAELKAELEKQHGLILNAATIAQNASKQKPSTGGKVTFRDAVKEAFEANEEVQQIIADKGMKKGKDLNIEIKLGPITEASSILSTGTYNTLTSDTGVISPIRRRAEKYLSAVTTGTIDNRFAMWIEETDEEGTPIMIAENTGKTNIDVQYLEKTQKVEKIAVYTKVSTELLADLSQLTSQIESNMMKRVAVAIETALYSGNGVTPNIKGAKEWSTTFAAGSLAATIARANEIDVINAVANQVELAFGTPTAIFVHPDTMGVIKGIKSSGGHPLWKDYQDWSIADGVASLTIGGMRVISTPVVTSGEFVGGDTSVLNVLVREGINVRMTPSGDDPINNLMTLIVEARLVQFVSANDTGCLIKGDFATAKAALNNDALA